MERQLLVHHLLQSQLCTFQIHCRAQGLVRLRRPSWLKSLIKMQQWGWSGCNRDWIARQRKWFEEVSYMWYTTCEVRINLTISIQKREVNVQFKRIHISYFFSWMEESSALLPAHKMLRRDTSKTAFKDEMKCENGKEGGKKEGKKTKKKTFWKKLLDEYLICLNGT